MSDSLEDIDGIGPTYADRLEDAGIGTVADLADTDADVVAEAADTSVSRAEDWIEQAVERGEDDEGEGNAEAAEESGKKDTEEVEREDKATEGDEGVDDGVDEVKDETDEAEEEGAEETTYGEGTADEDGAKEKTDESEAEDDEDTEPDESEEAGDEQEDEKEDEQEDDEDDEPETTKDKLEALGFYDNDFTEFPPELSGLKRFKAEKNPEPIIEALGIQAYDTTFMRLEMVEALGRIGDEAAVDVLLGEVNNNDTKMEAMDALGRIGSERATEKILELLDPERKVQPHVRSKAAETAGRIGDPEAVGLLVQTLDSDSSEVRGTAAEALARIGADAEEADVVDQLAAVLEEETEETVRMSAARALKSLNTDEAHDALSEYENDRNELVAEAASAAQS
ncbi:MAG: HEAT repeat domain-containing protein [Halobacteria archaeon]